MENGRYTGRGYEDSKLTIDTLKVGQEIAKSTEPRAVHLLKRKGAPPTAAVLQEITLENIGKNYLKISIRRD